MNFATTCDKKLYESSFYWLRSMIDAFCVVGEKGVC